MLQFEAIAIVSIVGSALLSDIICIILLMALILDPYSTPQGLDYCLFSLLISDLLNNLVLATVWICSSINGLWFFGNNACKLFAFISYAFWLVDIMSLFWLSVDRYLFITDIKYSTYKLRTKARFICKIVLSWFVSIVYSFAPIVAHKTGRYLKHSFVCVLNSINLEAYYATMTVIIIMPCFLGTNFNFGRIFFMRFKYMSQRHASKLSEADIELLMDSNHKMSVCLALVFWISWLPYITYLLTRTPNEPHLIEYWIGKIGAIWRLLILTMFFPRYRCYLHSIIVSVKSHLPSFHRNCHKKIPSSSVLHVDECNLHI